MTTKIEGNGARLANEVFMLVRRLAYETEAESRNTARDDAKEELRLGQAQAEALHAQADDVRSGAIWSGLALMASSVGQGISAVGVWNSQKNSVGSKVAEEAFAIAGGGKQAAEFINQGFQAAGKDHEADAQMAAARARAVAHHADEAANVRRAAHDVAASVTESYKAIRRDQHETLMATLASRG